MNPDPATLLTSDRLEGELHAIGAERYHDRHPFHHLMRDGKLTRGQLQAWALNRYYYQAQNPGQGRLSRRALADAGVAARMAPPHPRS